MHIVSRERLRTLAVCLFSLVVAQPLMAQHSWTGGGDGTSWTDPANWSTGTIPGPGDDAAITASDAVVVVAETVYVANLTLTGGNASLRLDTDLTVTDDYTQGSSTTLTGAARLAVDDTLFWSGGTMSGAGTTSVRGVLYTTSSSAKTLAARRLLIETGARFDYANGYSFYGQEGAVLEVASGATVDIRTNNNYRTFWDNGVGGAPRIENDGAFVKSAGTTAAVQIGWDFVNRGVVAVEHTGGQMQITGTLTDGGGTYSATVGRLDFTALGSNFSPGSVIESGPDGTIDFSGGTATINGTYDVQGTTEVSGSGGTGAHVTISTDANFVSLGEDLAKVHDRGTFRLLQTSTVTLDSLSLGFGATVGFGGPVLINGGLFQENNTSTLELAGDVTLEGPMTWEGGTITGAGSIIATGGLTITGNAGSASNSKTLDGPRLLLTPGATGRQVGTLGLSGVNGAVFEIAEGAVFEFDSWANWDGTDARVINRGTLQKTGGDSDTRVEWALNNSGTVQGVNDLLDWLGPIADDGGSYGAGPGAELRLSNPDVATTFTAGSRFFGGGTMHFGPGFVATINGTYEMKGTTRMSSNGTSIRSDVTLPDSMTNLVSLGRTLDLGNDLGGSGGVLRVETTGAQTLDTLLIAGVGQLHLTPDLTVTSFVRMGNQNALLTGTGDVFIQGRFEFAGGEMRSSFSDPQTVRADGGVRFLGGAGSASWTKTLNATNLVLGEGTTSTYEGTRSLEAGNQSTVTVETGATLDIQSSADFVIFTGSDFPAYLVNHGTVSKTGGDSDTRIQLDVENHGLIGTNNDVLDLEGAIAETDGGWVVGTDAELRFSHRGEAAFGSGSTIQGAGTVHFAPGFIGTVLGTYDVSGTTRMSSNGTSIRSDVTLPDSMTNLVSLGRTLDLGNDLGGSGGIMRIETPDPLTIGTLQIAGVGQLHLTPDLTVTGNMLMGNQNALLTGTGDVLVQGQLDYGGGAMRSSFGDPQTIVIAGGARFYGGAGSASWDKTLDGSHLLLTGGTSVFEGTHNLATGNGAVLEIGETATLDIQSWTDIAEFSGSDFQPRLVNNGILRKSGGDSDTRLYPDVENNGVIEVTNDVLAFYGAVGNNGTVQGTTALNLASATSVSHTGTIAPGAPSVSDPDSLLYGGAFDNSSGTFAVTLGDGATDQLQVASGTATLGGILDVSLASGFDPPEGATFTILTADAVSGTFASENLPTLPSGRYLQVQYNPTDVTLTVGSASPATIYWTGAGDGVSWSDPANWDPTRVPGEADTAVINRSTSSNYTVEAPGDLSIAALRIGESLARVAFNGTVTVSGDVTINEGILRGQGMLQIGGDFVLNGSSSFWGVREDMSIDVAGQLLWYGDMALDGSGDVTVHGGAVMSGEQQSERSIFGRTLTLHDSSLFSIDWGKLNLGSGAVLNIPEGAVLEFTERADVYPQSDSSDPMPVINNYGQIIRTDEADDNTFDQVNLGYQTYDGYSTSFDRRVLVNNYGTIEARNGRISVYFAEGSVADGTYAAAAGAMIRLYRGEEVATGVLPFPGALTGAGTFLSDGPFQFTGSINVPGQVTISAASIFDQALDIQNLQDLYVNAIEDELFTFDTPGSYTFRSLRLGRVALTPDVTVTDTLIFGDFEGQGFVSGPGNILVEGVMNWGGGTLGGTGSFTINGALNTLSEEGYSGDSRYLRPYDRYLERDLALNGTANYRDGTLHLGNGSNLVISSGAVFDLTGDGNFAAGTTPGSILNSGTFRKTGVGKSDYLFDFEGNPMDSTENVSFGSIIGVPFVNDGRIDFDAGRTRIEDALTNRGRLTGTDSLDLRDPLASFTNEGTVAPGDVSERRLTVLGGLAQGTGPLEIELRGTTPGVNQDQLLVSGTATLSDTLDVSLEDSYLPAPGDSFVVVLADTLNGTFDAVNLPPVQSGYRLEERYTDTAVVLEVVAEAGLITWTGAGDGTSWSDPQNWNPQRVPGADDDVEISLNGEYTIQIASDVTVSSLLLDEWDATVAVGAPLVISGDLTLHQGTFSGGGAITIGGALSWRAGNFIGSGTVDVTGLADVYETQIRSLRGRTLRLNGGAVYRAGANNEPNLQLDGSTIVIPSGTTFDMQSNSYIVTDGTPGRIVNEGTLRRSFETDPFSSGSAGATALEGLYTGSGAIEVRAGTLELRLADPAGGDPSALTGAISISEGAELELTGPASATSVSGGVSGAGTLDIPAGVFTLGGSYNVTGATSVGPDADVTVAADVTSMGALALDGGRLTFEGSGTFPTAALTLTGAPQLILPPEALLDAAGPASLTGTLNVSGFATSPADGASYPLITASSLSGTFDTENLPDPGTGLYTNLDYAAGGVTLTVTSDPGPIVWTGEGDGFTWSDAANWSPQLVPTASDDVEISLPDTIQIAANATAGTLLLDASEAALDIGAPLAISDALTIRGGALTGAGAVNVGGSFTWTGGGMTGSGTLQVVGATTIRETSMKGLVGWTLQMHGGGVFTAGANNEPGLLLEGGTLVIPDGTIFDVQSNSFIISSEAIGRVINDGTLRRSVGADTTAIQALFGGSGLIDVTSGTLSLSVPASEGDFTNTLTDISVATGATVMLHGSTADLPISGSVSGAGTIQYPAGLFTYSGPSYNLTGATEIASDASLTMAGAVESMGDVLVDGGIVTFTAATYPMAALTLTGAPSLTLPPDAVLDVAGTATLLGTLNVGNFASTPSAGDRFPLITATSVSGTFDAANLPDPGSGLEAALEYAAGGVTLAVSSIVPPDGELISWTGLGDGASWSDALNWDLERVPAPVDSVEIALDQVETYVVDAAGDLTVQYLRLGAPQARLTIDGSFTINDDLVVGDGAVQGQGTLTVGDDVQLDGTSTSSGLHGAMAVDVGGRLVWQGAASLAGSGQVSVQGGAEITGDPQDTRSVTGRTLTLFGSSVFNIDTGAFDLGSGAVLNIQPEAVIEFASRADVHPTGSSTAVLPVINNHGRIVRTDPGEDNIFDQVNLGSYESGDLGFDRRVVVNNYGTIEAAQGSISVYFAEGSEGVGSFAAAEGALMRMYRGEAEPAGPMQISGGVSGAGTFVFDGAFHLTGSLNATGSLSITGSTLFDESLEITSLPPRLLVSASGEEMFRLETPGSFTLARLEAGRMTLTPDLVVTDTLVFGERGGNGLLLGAGNVRVAEGGQIQWGGGTIGGTGSLDVDGTLATLSDSGYEGDREYFRPYDRYLARTLTLAGSAKYRDGTLHLQHGGNVRIPDGAAFEFTGDGNIFAGADAGSIVNEGTFVKSGVGKADYVLDFDGTPSDSTENVSFGSVIQVPFVNSGRVELIAGRTRFESELSNQSVLAGSDTLDLRAATFTNEGTLAPGGGGPGFLTVLGDYENGSGRFEIELSGTDASAEFPEHDRVRVSGAARLSGTLQVNLLSVYRPAAGDEFVILEASSVEGSFDEIIVPEVISPAVMSVQYGETEVRLRVDPGVVTEPELAVSPESIHFGTVPVDSTETAALTVSNTGTADLSVEGFTFDGDGFSTPSDAFVLAPEESRELAVSFTPTDAVSYSATLTIESNAGNPSVELSGEGIQLNTAPIAGADRTTTDEDVPVSINVLANDSDPQGDSLHIARFTAPQNGTVAQEGDSLLVYTPALDFVGEDTLYYTITDGALEDSNEVVITVRPVNDPPIASDDEAEAIGRVPILIDVLANDADPEGDVLMVASVQNPTDEGGAAAADGDGLITYAAARGFTGTDTFAYTVQDDEGATDEAVVTVTVAAGVPVEFAVDDLGIPGTASRAGAINDDGVIVGSYLDSGVIRTFEYKDGEVREVVIPGATAAQAYDVDASGRIVGYAGSSDTTGYAFLRRPNGDVVDIGGPTSFSSAYAVAGNGLAVGTILDDSRYRAFSFQNAATTILDVDAPHSTAYGVNDAGTVVGVAEDGDATRAFIDEQLLEPGSRAYDVSEAGVVVGSMAQGGETLAYRWDEGGGTALPEPESGFSEAYAVNDAGWTVGAASYVAVSVDKAGGGTASSGFSGMPEKGSTESLRTGVTQQGRVESTFERRWLRPFRSAAKTSSAAEVAANGSAAEVAANGSAAEVAANGSAAEVAAKESGAGSTSMAVSAAASAIDLYAVLWIDGTLYNLNDLIGPESGWTLIEARDVNSAGEIVGYGELGGQIRAFRLRPTDNRRPTATADEIATAPGLAQRIQVLANDTDADGDKLTLMSASAEHGDVSIDGAALYYAPEADFSGEDRISYVVGDGRGGTAVGEVRVTVTAPVDLPETPVLAQNYPNPFNPTTVIEFALPAAMPVQLVVFNALGQEVAVLLDGPQEEGRTSFTFDAAGLPVGTYFYQLRADGRVQTRTLTLVK